MYGFTSLHLGPACFGVLLHMLLSFLGLPHVLKHAGHCVVRCKLSQYLHFLIFCPCGCMVFLLFCICFGLYFDFPIISESFVSVKLSSMAFCDHCASILLPKIGLVCL